MAHLQNRVVVNYKKYGPIEIPAGTPVKFISTPSGGRCVVNGFGWIPASDLMLMHDATHYYIFVNEKDVSSS